MHLPRIGATSAFVCGSLILLTPACHRVSASKSLTLFPPLLNTNTLAVYYDVDANGQVDAGDRLVLPFTVAVDVTSDTATELSLSGVEDTFGLGAKLEAGQLPNEVQLTLGAGAQLKTRQIFDLSSQDHNRATGVRVNGLGGIVNSQTGLAAGASDHLDIVPGFVTSFSALPGLGGAAVASADLNHDGLDDLVIGYPDIGFHTLLGDGSGGFSESYSEGSLAGVTTLALGDINGDGKLDLAVGSANGAHIFIGLGTGAFESTGVTYGEDATNEIQLADVTQDGKLDLLRCGALSLECYGGLGDGSFTIHAQAKGSQNVRSLAVADFNRDGKLDLALGEEGPNHIWLGTGDGFFITSTEFGDSTTNTLLTADINRDGALDLICGNDGPTIVYLGDGLGGFSESGHDLGDGNTRALFVNDVDEDGRLDLLIADEDVVRIYMQNNQGAMVESGQRAGNAGIQGIATLDADGDGDLDMVTTSPLGGNSLLLSSLAGTWGKIELRVTNQHVGTGVTFSMVHGDFDRDGDLDIVTGNNFKLELFTNNGAGFFGDAIVLHEGSIRIRGLATADLDMDGDLDLVGGNIGPGTRIWLNDGAGAFTIHTPVDGGGNLTNAIALGDIDGDGDIDLIRGNMNHEPDEVLLNLGVGGHPTQSGGDVWQGFGEPQDLTAGGQPFLAHTGDVLLADLDRDGDLDLFCGYGNGMHNRWWANDGSGNFTIQDQLLGLLRCRSLTVGDVNCDGNLDIVTGNAVSEQLLLGDGAGHFDALPGFSVSDTHQVLLVDVTGDRDLDLLVANQHEQGLQIYKANDDCELGERPADRLKAMSVASIMAIDVDRDGDLDIINGNVDAEANKIWFNQ